MEARRSSRGVVAHSELRALSIHVVARQRHVRPSFLVRLYEQRLNEVHTSDREPVGGRRHIHPPDTIRSISRDSDCLRGIFLEPANPVSQRGRVVLTQALDIAQLETDSAPPRDHVRYRDQLSLGEDIL